MRTWLLISVIVPLVAAAQPADEVAAPAWNVGAGVGFSTSVIGIGGLSSLGGSSSGLSGLVAGLPGGTVLIERRLTPRLFLTFRAGVSYGSTQDELAPDLTNASLSIEARLGVRRVLNPGGIIEVSWMATVDYQYASTESHSLVITSADSAPVVQGSRSRYSGINANLGLALERELVPGLALRLSSGVLTGGYGFFSWNASTPDASNNGRAHGFQVGLRFSPALELRYSF